MIKYKTNGWGRNPIVEVEVDRETESSVVIAGRRRAKVSAYEAYHDSWEDAKAYLMDGAEKSLKSARRKLEEAQGYYGNVKGLNNPALTNNNQ